MESRAEVGKLVGFCISGGRAEEPEPLCDPGMSPPSTNRALLGEGKDPTYLLPKDIKFRVYKFVTLLIIPRQLPCLMSHFSCLEVCFITIILISRIKSMELGAN